MTREQESDSTLLPEKEEGGMEHLHPKEQKKTRISASIAWWVCITTDDTTKRGDVFFLWR